MVLEKRLKLCDACCGETSVREKKKSMKYYFKAKQMCFGVQLLNDGLGKKNF